MLLAMWSYGAELVDSRGRGGLDTESGRKGGEVFLELLKYAPPNVKSYNFADVNKAIQLGQAVMAIQWASGAKPMEDKTRSSVAGAPCDPPLPKSHRQAPLRRAWTRGVVNQTPPQP